MTLPFATSDDLQESPIVYFLQQYQQCVFYKMDKIKKMEGNKIICIKNNINQTDCLNVINTINFSEFYTNIFLIPKKIGISNMPPHSSLIYYPIKYLDFYKVVQSVCQQTSKIYKNLHLSLGSFLTNKNNNKKIFMTETEKKILTILFDKIIVKKDLLRQSILNFHPGVETKSLESHLSRIRKKILEIGDKTNITSKNSEFIRIL
ncbi:helix-turn-helix domain-containing protein [Alphaproteobacteria bacterium]|nr:helix-turn-helix domain-containing protein [Alphaproteobacteria bacterium]